MELPAMASSSNLFAVHQSLPSQHDRFSQSSSRSNSKTGFQTPPRSSSQLNFMAEPQEAPSIYTFQSLADISRQKTSRPLTARSEVNALHTSSISSRLDRLQTSVNDLSPLPQPTFLTPARDSDIQKCVEGEPLMVAKNPYLQRDQPSRNSILPQKRSHQVFQEPEDQITEPSSQPMNSRPIKIAGSKTHETLGSQPGRVLINPDVDLEAYAAQPRTQRLESLDDWILAKINDESFLRLLEDMQQAWRRIGLNRY